MTSILLACTPALGQDSERTRAIMGRLLESLQVLLAYQGSAAQDRETTLEAARALAADAEALSIHARRMDETAVFVGNSLYHDAREIEESLERGDVRARAI